MFPLYYRFLVQTEVIDWIDWRKQIPRFGRDDVQEREGRRVNGTAGLTEAADVFWSRLVVILLTAPCNPSLG
jgi:hypothetical protein